MIRRRGLIDAAAWIRNRAWQIYRAQIFLFVIYIAEIAYLAGCRRNLGRACRRTDSRKGSRAARAGCLRGRCGEPSGAAAASRAGSMAKELARLGAGSQLGTAQPWVALPSPIPYVRALTLGRRPGQPGMRMPTAPVRPI